MAVSLTPFGEHLHHGTIRHKDASEDGDTLLAEEAADIYPTIRTSRRLKMLAPEPEFEPDSRIFSHQLTHLSPPSLDTVRIFCARTFQKLTLY